MKRYSVSLFDSNGKKHSITVGVPETYRGEANRTQWAIYMAADLLGLNQYYGSIATPL